MKLFQCTNCGVQLQRPTQPFSCPQCGRQAVNLFRPVAAGGPAAPTMPPQPPAGYVPPTYPQQPVYPQQPPAQPSYPPPAAPGQLPSGAVRIPTPPRPPQTPYRPPAAPVTPPNQPAAQQPPPANLYGPPQQQPTWQPQPQPPQQPACPAATTPPAAAWPTAPASAPQPPQQPPAQPAAPSPPTQQPPTAVPQPAPRVEPQAARPASPPASPTPAAPAKAPAAQRPAASKPATPSQPPREKPAAQRPAAERPANRPFAPATEKPAKPPAAPEKPKPQPKPRPRPQPVRPAQFAWAFPPEPPYPEEAVPLRHAPAVDAEGQVYLHHADRLVALKEADGKATVVWEYVTGCRAPGPVVLASDGTLRLHTADGRLHAITPAGKQLWPPAKVGEPLANAAPVVDEAGNTYTSGFDGGLLKVDARGKLARPAVYRGRQRLDCGGVLRAGVLYIGSDEGYLLALDLRGQRAENLWNQTAEQGHAGWYIRCWPALTDDGVLVVPGQDEHLYGFRLEGAFAFRTPMPGQMLGSPVVDRHGQIYVGTSTTLRGQPPRGSLVCLDGNSHQVRWEYKARGPVEATPVIGSDDVIYCGDNAGVVHAVDFRGQALWSAEVGSPVRSAGAILAPERVAFGLDDQTLVVLKCSSPALADAGWPKIGRTLAQNGLA